MLKTLVFCSLLVAATTANAATITTTHLTDKLDLNLQSTQSTAIASIAFETQSNGPSVVWAIGAFTPADVGRDITLSAVTSGTSTVDWAMLDAYLAQNVTITETIASGDLTAHTVWQLPHDAYRGRVIDLRFKLEAFIVEPFNGAIHGYLAGTYKMTFEQVPEPSVLVLLLPLLLLSGRKR